MTPPTRLVLDTNIVVSGVLWGGRPAELLRLGGSSKVRFYSSEVLMAELRKSLAKPKFSTRVNKSGLTAIEHVENYRGLVTMVDHGALPQPVSRDPDDDHVLACALAASADAVVTGDDDLLVISVWKGIAILQVRDCLELLKDSNMPTSRK